MARFDAYLRYSDVLILGSAVPTGRGVCGGGTALEAAQRAVSPPRKFLIITNKLIVIMTT